MNRSEDLNRCLESVFQSQTPPEEVIVSDDSFDSEPTKTVVANYPGAIYQQGPQRGLGPNRNACIKRATGSHIMFIDDDVCVPPNCFTIARQLISTCEPKTIITGHEMNHGGGGRWEGEVRKVIPKYPDFWGLQKLPTQNEQYRSFVMNATLFPRSLFDRALFDENLRYGCDEIDMARHAKSLGYQIVYQDNLYVNHYPSPINREHYKRFVQASRLYATAKAYWRYERSPSKTIAYLLLAPLQLAGSSAKKGDFKGVWDACRSTVLAYQYFVKSNS
jgi:GT2 family glycosyltransferase